MPPPHEPSHPPSDPQPLRASGLSLHSEERPTRLQLGAALAAGLLLVAGGLYLWRRPHAPPDPSADDAVSAPAPSPGGDSGMIVGAGSATGPDAGASSSGVAVSEPRVLACQDRGRKKTAPDACDRLAAVEQALSKAIAQAATCVPPSAGGGTIEYVADVSFAHHKVGVSLPRAGRSVKDKKTLRACSAAVRGVIQGLGLDGIEHQHARYKIAVTATYRGSATGG